MSPPLLLGLSDVSVETTAAVGTGMVWVAILGIGCWQYANGEYSREQLLLVVSMVSFGTASSFGQIVEFVGITETAAFAVLVGLSCVGFAALVQWWRVRHTDSETADVAG